MTKDQLFEILSYDVVAAGPALLGATLVRGSMRARIVEVEAYRSDDPACHAFQKRTPRTEVLYGPPGIAYVYFNYGVHWMLNIVAHERGDPAALLIRAAVPITGLDVMRANRIDLAVSIAAPTIAGQERSSAAPAAATVAATAFKRNPQTGQTTLRDTDLLSGPGKLAKAFGITGADNGVDLFAESPTELYMIPPESQVANVLAGPRVGIATGKWEDVPWRFVDGDARQWLSGKKS